MVVVARRGISEQALQQSVHVGRRGQIATVHHGYFLQMIVYRYRQMIAGRYVFARQNDVAETLWFGFHQALVFVLPGKRPCNRRCALHIKTAHVWIALCRSGLRVSHPTVFCKYRGRWGRLDRAARDLIVRSQP